MTCRLTLALLAATLPAAAQYTRGIAFPGYTWMVKSCSTKVGPRPNFFSGSTSNVWVDGAGRPHMKITKSGTKWYSAEVINTSSLGYGTYRFYLESAVDNLDPNVVLGLFTWNDAPDYNHREIDIEFSRWGNARDATNSQYVVQPYNVAGIRVRFTGPPAAPNTVHSFLWGSSSVYHRSVNMVGPSLTKPPATVRALKW